MAKIVGFKHFESDTGDGLCEDMAEWVNGETESVSYIAEFHIILKGTVYHAFVKYITED